MILPEKGEIIFRVTHEELGAFLVACATLLAQQQSGRGRATIPSDERDYIDATDRICRKAMKAAGLPEQFLHELVAQVRRERMGAAK